jgi:tetratricopeptide (TPR) repeat protein
VARLALQRPLASLGLVGILESRNALRQRIERLIDFRPPRTAGLTLVSVLCVVAFGALAVPMGEPAAGPEAAAASVGLGTTNSSANIGRSSTNASPEQKMKAAAKVQDGQLLYQMGRLDEAEKKLKEVVKADPQNQAAYYYLNLVTEARYKDALDKRRQGLTAENARTAAPRQELLPVPNLARRQAVYRKLDSIRLDRVLFDGLPLRQALDNLSEQARVADPEKLGFNFIINRAFAAGTMDISSVTINIKPALTSARLADVLDAIVKAADKPIQYTVGTDVVVFSPKGQEAWALYTRPIKVDPNTFIQGLQTVVGSVPRATSSDSYGNIHAAAAPTNDMVSVSVSGMLREFFTGMGVDLGPPRTIFFNETEGTLFVRATLQELDRIEAAVQALNIPPPQVNIKAKFIEVQEEAAVELWTELVAMTAANSND